MDTSGTHILCELWGCSVPFLNEVDPIQELMLQAASLAQARVVNALFHQFAPQGVTGVVVLEESHLSIHTWPETAYVAVDIYTCGSCLPEKAIEYLEQSFVPERVEILRVNRGNSTGQSMTIETADLRRHSLSSLPSENLEVSCLEKPLTIF